MSSRRRDILYPIQHGREYCIVFMKCQHLSVNVFLVILDIFTVKIDRNIYVNEEKAVSEIQILINKTFLLFSHHELLSELLTDYSPEKQHESAILNSSRFNDACMVNYSID